METVTKQQAKSLAVRYQRYVAAMDTETPHKIAQLAQDLLEIQERTDVSMITKSALIWDIENGKR